MARQRRDGRLKHERNGGPRIDLTEKQLEELARLMALGLTQWEACDHMGIAERTLRRRLQDDPRVVAAIAKGKAQAASSVANALYRRARAGHLGHIVWWEKTRRGLSDRIAVEHGGKVGIEQIEAELREPEADDA